MSLRQAKFSEVLGNPLNTHNFLVRSRLLEGIEVLVRATTFPTETMRNYTLYYMGETILYPALPESSGAWACTLQESESALVFKKAIREKGLIWKQKSGLLVPGIKTEIEVVSRDLQDKELFTAILHGAWITGKDAVNLDNSAATTNWAWNLTFNYDWIEDKEKV